MVLCGDVAADCAIVDTGLVMSPVTIPAKTKQFTIIVLSKIDENRCKQTLASLP